MLNILATKCCEVQVYECSHTKLDHEARFKHFPLIDKKRNLYIHLRFSLLFSGHCSTDSQTDREGSGFLCVVFWLLFCIHTSVCFRITGHSIRSHISESYNNNPGYGKLTCCLFQQPIPTTFNIKHSKCTVCTAFYVPSLYLISIRLMLVLIIQYIVFVCPFLNAVSVI